MGRSVHGPRAPVPPIAFIAAALFVIVSVIFQLRTDTAYPQGIEQWWVGGGIISIAIALVMAALPFEFVRALPSRAAALLNHPSPRTFAIVVALFTMGVSAGLALYAFERYPRTSDEIAQLWHAKVLLHGRLSLPVDANAQFFAMDNVVDTGKWYSQFPVGGPAILAIGTALGVPWLVNPVLAGVAAAALYHFARRAFGETEGRAVAALFAITPTILMMSGTYMNHVPVLCFAMCALAALVEWERSAGRRAMLFAALIGLAIGAIATIRPLDAIVVAVVVGVFQFAIVAKDRTRINTLAVQAIAGAIAVAPLLYANWATTGHPFIFGYEVLWGPGHDVGFHLDPHGEMHTLSRGIAYVATYVTDLNVSLMMWPVPVLLFAIAGLLAMKRASKWDALLLGFFWLQLAAYACYWFMAPRFLFTAFPAIIALLARTPFFVAERTQGFWKRAVIAVVCVCIVASVAVSSTFSMRGRVASVRNTRRAFRVDIGKLVTDAKIHHALVFLREPFGTRLQHRLWGQGIDRSDGVQLLAKGDACSLLAAVRAVEHDTAMAAEKRPDEIISRTQAFEPSGPPVRTADVTVHISSMQTLTPECKAEFDDDTRLGVATFGPALLLEPIASDGRIDGDVIYVTDLGDRNEVLRARFGDRKWYRLSSMRAGAPTPFATITPY